MLRKFYAGAGGCLPPTDERILNMTPEQIDLEYEHIELDKALSKGTNVYADTEYKEYEAEVEAIDARLSDGHVSYKNQDRVKDLEKRDDWEDIEIDDF